MKLLERETVLDILAGSFSQVRAGEGRCVLISGEAGIGKTSVVKHFCEEEAATVKIFQSSCDPFFSPRPLAPVFDMVSQLDAGLWESLERNSDRMELFTSIVRALEMQTGSVVLVLEDIHWADEATMDFVSYLGRRIARMRCLLLLTYRDNEIHSRHPLRGVLGQLPNDAVLRITLNPLSKETVESLARERGYDGQDVFQITGGIPFYVNEVLASYSTGVPENIKDAVISVFTHRKPETRRVWEWLSLFPTGFELHYLEQLEPAYASAVEECLSSRILLLQNGMLNFKHELYRRTIEESISPLVRITMNRTILKTFREQWEQDHQLERIIHHAKNANEYAWVVHYAPTAAAHAAKLGAHIESARLYYSAIEYNRDRDKDALIKWYEAYAYECYLTNQVKEAIVFQGRALAIWRERNDAVMTGNSLRFLSRLWWFDGNRKQAERYALEAIETLEREAPSRIKAMAYSNYSQLQMLADRPEECITWGEKAMAMARELGDEEILAHALNNIGASRYRYQVPRELGKKQLEESLSISLRNGYHEHVARAYTNMGSTAVELKEFDYAQWSLDAGIQYCEERDLKSWSTYMQGKLARLLLDTGRWEEAYRMAQSLINTENISAITRIGALLVVGTVNMRRGTEDALPFLNEAMNLSRTTRELQRIIPTMAAFLEMEWITGKPVLDDAELAENARLMESANYSLVNRDFAFWLRMARNQPLSLQVSAENSREEPDDASTFTASWWAERGCPYEDALLLFAASNDQKRNALDKIHQLGGEAIVERLKQEMRQAGIKSIPRGARKSTLANPANLTIREMEVLELLRDGIPNKEIASRLFISAKTVDHHISSILFKLDARSRSKAVDAAKEKGILK